MTNKQAVFDYVAAHPGLTTGQISKALGIDRWVTLRAINQSYELGDIFGDEHHRYYAVMPAPVSNPVFHALQAQAENLESRRLWRRAATVWSEAFWSADSAALRQKAYKRQSACCEMGKVGVTNTGYVAGAYCGVMELDW